MKINVVVHPNSKKPKIIKDLLQMIHIYVREPALEGKANAAVIKALADFYKIPKSHIKLITGLKSKIKILEINNDIINT